MTAEMRANAVANAKTQAWAARAQKAAIAAAQRWAGKSDDELWDLVTTQELPRDIHTNKEAGCPKCGTGITPYGNYPWRVAGDWKLKCPNCGAVFPKNDFWAFYKSALDEHGAFHRELGDKALLVNSEHPDPNDPLHRVYVDDGYGMLDEKGNRHRVIAYYNSWVQWARIRIALRNLARAYTLTDDAQYAHKAAVLLDRVADVYPDMDFAPFHKLGFEHSHGGRGTGRIQGCLWENDMVWTVAHAYDMVYDGIQRDEALVSFCSSKAKQYGLKDKGRVQAIATHIEQHLLLEMLKSYRDGRIDGNKARIRNPAAAAIALDRGVETEAWLDYLFDPGFPGKHYRHPNPVPWLAVEGLDRDGMGSMCGGYGLMQKGSLMDLAEVLAAYPDYTKHSLTADYPKLKQAFLVEARLACLDAAIPCIGDSGAAGLWSRPGRTETFVRGYALYRDPRMAALAWHYANGDVGKLRCTVDVYRADPDALAREIAGIAARTRLKLGCEHTGRYGQAILQTEAKDHGRALWVHYGYGKGHSHHDCLNIGLYAKNTDMLPDLGYPEYTGGWPKRHAWTANTISHNTLVVGDGPSGYSPGGKLGLFVAHPPVRVMEVSSRTAYPGLKTYRRLVALINVSDNDSYVLDIFRARGGTNHRLSYHGPGQEAAVEGAEFVRQPTGTLAGPDVPFAKLDGEKSDFYKKSGFSYLYDVERSRETVTAPFTVDWKAEDLRGRIKAGHEPRLRLHALTRCDEVALASGDPPQNKRGSPRRLRYLIQSRLGANVESQFVSVLEPYDKTRFIREVRRLAVEHDGDPNSVAAVAVDLADGATDILVSCEHPTRVEVEGGIEFEGRFAIVRLVAGDVKLMCMTHAVLLSCGDTKLVAEHAAYEGEVAKIDASDPANNLVFLDPPLPPDSALVGQTIHFENRLPLDTSYKIADVGLDWISTGDITIVRGFKSPKDFAAGYRYLVNPGDRYVVPNCVALGR